MLDSLSRQARRGGQIGRSALLRRIILPLVAAACLAGPVLLAACSQSPQRPPSDARAAEVAATVADTPTAVTPAPPLPTPASPPAEVPAQELPAASPEPPASPEEAAQPAFQPSTSPPEAAAPAPEPAEAPGPTPSPVIVSGNTAFVSRVVELINAARREEGLEPLSPAPSLTNAAQRQACAMAEADRLSHTAPDGSTMEGRVQAAGYSDWTLVGEVVAAGFESPEAVVEGWLADPGHRARLLDPAYREIGAGYYYLSSSSFGDWWVADLGAR